MPKSPFASIGSIAPSSLIVLLTAAMIYLAIYPFQPPSVVPANAPENEFSASRAAVHLEHIARVPRPTGSEENAKARGYIVGQMAALGLAPEVQTTSILRSTSRYASGATVSNIIGRLPGSNNSRALMLAAHYDSVPGSPGASDDGSGVATLLETARALKAGLPLQNDVIFLITDGEELGLLGAQAFMSEHPWAKDASVVLNFEARGSGGASVLFETSRRNGWLLRHFSAAAPHPVGYSVLYEFYKRMPNDTDFSVFRRGGLAGLNFAYGEGWIRYHTVKDNLQNIDLRSIQHDGLYALALARRLGSVDLSQPTDGEAIFFSFLGAAFYYSQAWAIPFAAGVTLLFAGVLVIGLKRGHLTWHGIILGGIGWLGAAILAAVISFGMWRMIMRTSLVSPLPSGIGYNSGFYAAAFLALAAAVVAGACAALHELTSEANLTAGMLIWWLVATVATSLFFPGASYLFTWPLALALASLGYVLIRDEQRSAWAEVLIWLPPAFWGIFLVAPISYALLSLLSTNGLVPLAAVTALLVGFLQPWIHAVTASNRGWLTAFLSLIALLLFAGAILQRGYDSENPKPDTLFYYLDADTGKAEWISADQKPDEWTSQYLGDNFSRGSLKELAPFNMSVLRSSTVAVEMATPQVSVLGVAAESEKKTLRLLITFPRRARALWLEIRGVDLLEASVSGKKVGGLPQNKNLQLYYVGIPEGGLVISLSMPPRANSELRVVAQYDGLPSIPGVSSHPRPENLMPSAWPPFNSSTLISKTFRNLETPPDALESIGVSAHHAARILNYINAERSIIEIRGTVAAGLEENVSLGSAVAYIELLRSGRR